MPGLLFNPPAPRPLRDQCWLTNEASVEAAAVRKRGRELVAAYSTVTVLAKFLG